MNRRRAQIRSGSVLVAMLFVASTTAQEASPPVSEQTAGERLELMKQSATIYRMTIGERANALKLAPEPLLRWNNPVSGIRDGIVSVWTHNGKPEIVAQVYVTRTGYWLHEFQSLASGPVEVSTEGQTFWRPRLGVARMPVPGAGQPHQSPARRLIQMKRLADRFAASVHFKREQGTTETSLYELRRIPRPLHRYGDEISDVVDGALFAFVQGTNPEVFLLIEARPSPAGPQWTYGLSPMTGYEVQASLDGAQIWNVPARKKPFPVEGPYFSVHYKKPDKRN